MKRIIIIISLIFIAASSVAQTIIPFTLTFQRKLKHVSELPFDKVVVFDSRFDTTKIQITEDGRYPVSIVQFSTPTTEAIKTYIEAEISRIKKIDRVLYINIKQLRYTNYNHSFVFSAACYFKINNHFIRIVSMKNDDFRTDGFQKTISKALCDLIEKVNADYYQQNKKDVDTETAYDCINVNVMNEWEAYPIIKNDTPVTNGVYETFDDFRDNKITPTPFRLQMNADSTFNVYFPENNKRYYSRMSKQYRHIFAVSYNGNMYISIFGKFFLPLDKRNNTFYFHVPNSLPDMYSIISERLLQFQGYENAAVTNEPVAVLIGGVIGIVQQKKANKQILKEKEDILSKGLSNEDMRSCFLDMDTGDIIY